MSVRRNLRLLLGLTVVMFGSLACGSAARRQLVLYPTPTHNATPTNIVVEITTTPVTVLMVITQTPNAAARICVQADVAVNLRPSPSNQNYPIMVIPNGTELNDLGGRNGKWLFVELGDKQGWINQDYVGACQ